MAAAKTSQLSSKQTSAFILIGAVAAAGYAIYEGFPGIALIWAAFIVAAWMQPPAVFTGRKDSRGYPTSGGPHEDAAMVSYRYWSDLKWKLALPSLDWAWKGKLPDLNFLAALWAGAAAFFIPVSHPSMAGYGPWVNAAAAYILVAQIGSSKRRTMVLDDECPPATMDVLITWVKQSPGKAAAFAGAGFMTGGAVATAASVILPILTDLAGANRVPEPAIWVLLLTGGPLAALARPWSAAARAHWKVVVDARAEWVNRWMQLKQDPAPRLIDRREVGPAVVDTFEAPAGVGAAMYWTMGPKIGPTMGTASRFAVLSVENLDSSNQPVPGTRHPSRFEIVDWPSDQLPDITDPNTPQDVVFELVRCALVWMADGIGSARPIANEVHLLTVNEVPETSPAKKKDVDPEALIESWKTPSGNDSAPAPAAEEEDGEAQAHQSPAAWAITFYAPDGPPAEFIRQSGIGALSGTFNAEVAVDHRAMNRAGVIYAGALTDPNTEYDPGVGVNADTILTLQEEDVWDGRWIEVMKMGSNPPVMQPATKRTERLRTGVEINSLSFVTRQGMPPKDFFNFEAKMPTVLSAAPFVTMTGFPDPKQIKQRHQQAFTLLWSHSPVPMNPDTLAPSGNDAAKWVLAGLVNDAFRVARLAERPDIARVTCLTDKKSRKHIWKIDLYLRGGVNLAEVRGAANKFKTHWGTKWLRIGHDQNEGTVSIVAGEHPTKATVTPAHLKYVTKLEWDQVFLDSGVSGLSGVLPRLEATTTLPKNPAVSVLDFQLPAGLDFTAFTAARNKLESNSGNAYVEPRKIKDTPNMVRLLACEVNPMPEKADYDWEYVDSSKFIPFATGIEGEPVEYNFKLDPHLLIAGASGGGKSVLLQSLAYGAMVRGYDLYVADPTKGGADFKFAEPYAKAFTDEVFMAAAMMKAIYAEVVRRKNLNKTYGVGNYRDLPEDVRPNHIVILLDEFTSLMNPDPEPKPSDDMEMDAEREAIVASNRAKTEIGVFTGKIAREARSAGVTLFLATQKLSAKMLDTIPGAGDLKVNLSRLLLGKATYGDKQSALRAPQDAPDLGDAIPPGRGLFETTAGAAMAIQAWYNPEEQAVLARMIAERREPLAEEEKTDLTVYLPKERQPRPPVVEQDEIVDLGEIELGLEDLELDLGLDGEEALELEQASAVFTGDTVIFLDVDGVIAPFINHADLLASGEHVRLEVPGRGTFAYSPSVLGRIAAMPAPVVWATNWDTDASEAFGALIPGALDTMPYVGEESGWWKLDAAAAWLKSHPQVRRVIWVDDMLCDEDELLGITYMDEAAELLEGLGVEVQFIVPEPDNGLDSDELEMMESFAGGHTPALPPAPEEAVPAQPAPRTEPEPALTAAAEDEFVAVKAPRKRKAPVPAADDGEFVAYRAAKPAPVDVEEEFVAVRAPRAEQVPVPADDDLFG